jgi:hypothetical protein
MRGFFHAWPGGGDRKFALGRARWSHAVLFRQAYQNNTSGVSDSDWLSVKDRIGGILSVQGSGVHRVRSNAVRPED